MSTISMFAAGQWAATYPALPVHTPYPPPHPPTPRCVPAQAIELLESALELRRQLFSNSSFLYADTAALLAKTLMQQHTAAVAEAAAAAAEAGSSGSSWYSRLTGSSSSSSQGSGRGGKPSGPPDVLRAIGLWQQAIKIVEDSGGVKGGETGRGGGWKTGEA